MENLYLKQVGSRLSKRRKQLKYTKRRLSEETGVPVEIITKLEQGKAVGIEPVAKICKTLDISADYLLSGSPGIIEAFRLMKTISTLSEEDYEMIASMMDYFTKYPYENAE